MTPKIHMRYKSTTACGVKIIDNIPLNDDQPLCIECDETPVNRVGMRCNECVHGLVGLPLREREIETAQTVDSLRGVTCEECKAYFSKDAIVYRLAERIRRVPKPERGY